MKKLIILAAMVLTIGAANANAGVSFEISVGQNHGKGYSRGGHGPVYHAPRQAPPRYVVRECVSCRPRYHHGYWGHGRGHARPHGHGYSHRHGHGYCR
jgi:hypothetical protein